MKQIDEFIKQTADKLGLEVEGVDKVIKSFFGTIKNNTEQEKTPFFSIPAFGKLYHRYYKKPRKNGT